MKKFVLLLVLLSLFKINLFAQVETSFREHQRKSQVTVSPIGYFLKWVPAYSLQYEYYYTKRNFSSIYVSANLVSYKSFKHFPLSAGLLFHPVNVKHYQLSLGFGYVYGGAGFHKPSNRFVDRFSDGVSIIIRNSFIINKHFSVGIMTQGIGITKSIKYNKSGSFEMLVCNALQVSYRF